MENEEEEEEAISFAFSSSSSFANEIREEGKFIKVKCSESK